MNPQAGFHPDRRALERIEGGLDETLFVMAGAGSGKTRTLVNRLVNLVLEGGVPLRHIAAITFTEKAAAELRERVRGRLNEAAGRGVERAVGALEELDGAAIGTLHSFAQRLLVEHAVDAGLPPRVEVLDEVASTVAFEERWRSFLDAMLENDKLADALLRLDAAGVDLDALRDIAVAFNQNWDLAASRPPAPGEPPGSWQPDLERLTARVTAVGARRGECRDGDDKLCRRIGEFADWALLLSSADETELVELLGEGDGLRPSGRVGNVGAKARWASGTDLPGLRAELAAVAEDADALRHRITHGALRQVAEELVGFTLDSVEQRRREGQLEFHDLLVMARQLLRGPEAGPGVRATAQQRYQRLLIDEFQDTDPVQVELAVLLASAADDAEDREWADVPVMPGRLFFVGDPKQSIYRFRRADIGMFHRAAARFGSDAQVTLTANHRSGRSLVDWFNLTFGRVMTEPAYVGSVSQRADPPTGPAVSVLGRGPHRDRPRADDVRSREAADVAAAVGEALRRGWAVDRSDDWRQPDWQPCRPGDVAILLPTRNSLSFVEDALTAAGIPYRTDSSSLVYAGNTVRDLLAALTAIDDPTNELMVVSALRSPLFGCGDDDLARFRAQGGRFDYTDLLRGAAEGADVFGTDDDPVAEGLRYMARLHERRRWATPSELLEQVVRDRRAFELATFHPRGRARDHWHRLRFVTDQARAWTEATGGTLRQYLAWVRRQATPGARVSEAVLPETDDDAVRIMTVHAAKGLQFPITVVAGLSTRPQARRAGGQAAWPPEGPCLLTVGSRVTSPAFEEWRPVDEQMDHDERLRLLYVACTRACDHLVLSLHRTERRNAADRSSQLTSAEVLVEAAADDLAALPDAVPPDAVLPDAALPDAAPPDARSGEAVSDGVASGPEPPPEGGPGIVGFADWAATLHEALAASSQPRTLAATTLDADGQPDVADEPGLQKRPRDLDLPPWRKGRYGTAFGRAMHGVLQVVDLATGEGAEAAVAAQATAEGVDGVSQSEHLGLLVDAALAAPTVREAAACPHWKEVHVAVPLAEDRMVEGYVDLLYRRGDGRLVVVDYKTGPEAPDADVGPLVERYRMQGASYAWAVGLATGEEVAEVVFVFATPAGPVEVRLPGLEAAIEEAREALALPGRPLTSGR